jgi:hypothetical protein
MSKRTGKDAAASAKGNRGLQETAGRGIDHCGGLERLVGLLKEHKILKYKSGDVEIELSPMAYYTEQVTEQSPVKEDKQHITDEDLLFWSAPEEKNNEMV